MGQQDEDELDRELADAEIAGDEGGFDDDMMDKMSSSPSIADGETLREYFTLFNLSRGERKFIKSLILLVDGRGH
jgi:hypothetical protein